MPSAVTHRGQLADPDVEAPNERRTQKNWNWFHQRSLRIGTFEFGPKFLVWSHGIRWLGWGWSAFRNLDSALGPVVKIENSFLSQ